MNAPKAQAIKKSRRGLVGWVAGGVVTALVVTLAVVASGFDSRETPREDPSVWVERMAGQYARVNTETAEIDTVRTAESPSGVVQTGNLGLLLTQGFGRAHTIDPAAPGDVHDDGAPGAEDRAEEAPPTARALRQKPNQVMPRPTLRSLTTARLRCALPRARGKS